MWGMTGRARLPPDGEGAAQTRTFAHLAGEGGGLDSARGNERPRPSSGKSPHFSLAPRATTSLGWRADHRSDPPTDSAKNALEKNTRPSSAHLHKVCARRINPPLGA